MTEDDRTHKFWLATKNQLSELAQKDNFLKQFTIKHGLKPQSHAILNIGAIYGDYCRMYNKLCAVYDEMLQVQKRPYIWNLIEAVVARIYEIHNELQTVEACEYTYIDNALIERHLIADDVQILCPFFYPLELRKPQMQYVVDEIMSGNRIADPSPTVSEIEREENERIAEEQRKAFERKRNKMLGIESEPNVVEVARQLTPEEEEKSRLKKLQRDLLVMIQAHEKARVDRAILRRRAAIKRMQLKTWKKKKTPKAARGSKKPRAAVFVKTITEAEKMAKLCILIVFRHFMRLKRLKIEDRKRKSILGMVTPSLPKNDRRVGEIAYRAKKHSVREEYYRQFVAAQMEQEARILLLRRDNVMEDIGDEVRQWFREWYDSANVFDEYPWPAEGGSILIVKGETMTIPEYLEWEVAMIKEKAENAGKTKEQLKEEKAGKKSLEQARAQQENYMIKIEREMYKVSRLSPYTDPGYIMEPGLYTNKILEEIEAYNRDFTYYENVMDSPDVIAGYLRTPIVEDILAKMNMTLREIVDEGLRLEHKLLVKALKKDNKKLKIKEHKAKKRPKPKLKKVKKVIDKTPDRTAESLFQELVDFGIIKTYPKVYLNDFLGDLNYICADLRAIPQYPRFPPSSLGDVRSRVMEQCIIPLGTNVSNKPKSVALVGPPQSGKKLLAHAICNETNAVLFDLSPEVVYDCEEKYPGAKGGEMLLHIVLKVAKLVGPSVIFVYRGERMLYGSVPKPEKYLNPKKLGGMYLKFLVKLLTPEDKVLSLTTVTYPWMCPPGKFKKIFLSGILLPLTDYGTVFLVLHQLLMKYHEVDRGFDCHSLAMVLQGYQISSIKSCVEKVMNADRIIRLRWDPLKPQEVLEPFLELDPPMTPKEREKYEKWYKKVSPTTSKMKEYQKMLSEQNIIIERDAKKGL